MRTLVYGYNNGLEGNPFTILVKTDNAGTSASNQFTLPLQVIIGLTYEYFVDWGDGEFTSHNTNDNVTHSFPTAGEYEIRIYGRFEKIFFNNGGDRLKLLKVLEWGDSYGLFANQDNAFHGCLNLLTVPNGNAFGNVTNMQNMFSGCSQFNSDISDWNVSNVTNMQNMFFGCSLFNADISSWNVSNVTNMLGAFYGCSQFNSDISGWNVANVTNMSAMFYNCLKFNSDISGWNVGNVTNMSAMFFGAKVFNINIGGWNVANVTNMANMFQLATAFNQNIGSWNISKVTNFTAFLSGKTPSTFSSGNLDAIYNGWSSRTVKPNIAIAFGTAKYTSAGSTGKAILTNAPNNWNITDGGI